MRLLAFGTYDTSVHPRFGVLLDGLHSLGDHVSEVNVPLGIDTATRVDILRRPWRLPQLLGRLLGRWSQLAAQGRRAYRGAPPDAVLVGYLGHFDVVLARLLFPRSRIVLDHLIFAADTARDRNAGGRVTRGMLRVLDRLALHSADIIVLDTAEHAAMVPARLRDRLVVCPVGAPRAWFDAGAAGPEPGEHGPLRVVFYGLFTPLQGAVTIAEAACLLAHRDDIRWTMVGRGQDLATARERADGHPHIDWVEWVPPQELPPLVAAHDVCLGIFGTRPKSLRVVPNKVFQGAAAGRAVITSDTPPQRAVLGEDACYVPPGDAVALSTAVARLADNRSDCGRLGRAARARALVSFTSASVAAPLHEALHRNSRPRGDAMPTTASPPPLTPSASLRWDVVERALDDLQPKSILELGCGQGAAGARMAARADYLAAEPDEASRAVATARIQPHGGTVLAGDHTAVPAGRTFDVVCAFEVLEHIENDAEALEEWRRFVRPGGHLLLSVPAWQDRFGPTDEQVGHFRRYDPEALRVLLESAGFTDVRTTLYGWPLGYALEGVRNWAAKREAGTSALSMADRTASSGRFRQPDDRSLVGSGIAVATWPFRRVQRLFPNRGVGLVATARLPLE